jgi:hypothetical protein
MIEAIIGIVVMAVAVPPMMVALSDASARRADAVLETRARWLAAERLEDVIADRHSTTRGWSYISSGNYGAEASISGFPGFARTVAIAETGASLSGAGTGYRRVTVTVLWTDGRGTARQLALATVLTDYTP